MNNCPYCWWDIQYWAKKCKHCKQWISEFNWKSRWEMIKPFLSYWWTILINIITLIIAIGILNSTYADYEKIVLSMLVIIYLYIISFSSAWGLSKTQELLWLNDEFRKIRKLLNINEEDESEDIQKFRDNQKKTQYKFYINGGFNFIIYVIAIFTIIWSL